jgi:hypothetical protein
MNSSFSICFLSHRVRYVETVIRAFSLLSVLLCVHKAERNEYKIKSPFHFTRLRLNPISQDVRQGNIFPTISKGLPVKCSMLVTHCGRLNRGTLCKTILFRLREMIEHLTSRPSTSDTSHQRCQLGQCIKQLSIAFMHLAHTSFPRPWVSFKKEKHNETY